MNNSLPDISVIIPCFNGARYICTAVDSALSQRGVSTEVVVVDDGSQDESLELLRAYGDLITLLYGPNHGASRARNRGVAVSRAPFIKYLDADDYLLPGALEAQLTHALSLPDDAFSYGRMLRLTEATGQLQPHGQRDACADNADTLENLVLDPPVTAALLYPRALIEMINGFDPDIALRDDFDLFVRALIAGYRPQASTAPVYVYRDHASEGRLSKRTSVADQDVLIAMFHRHKALMASAQLTLSELSIPLARTIWTAARNALRLGHTAQAYALFDLAKQMSPGAAVRGKLLYRALVRVIGPIRAEYLLQQLKTTRE